MVNLRQAVGPVADQLLVVDPLAFWQETDEFEIVAEWASLHRRPDLSGGLLVGIDADGRVRILQTWIPDAGGLAALVTDLELAP